MKTRRILSTASRIDLDDEKLIDRPGPGKAPSAFRIWSAGENMTDHGATIFSKRSAERLMQEQETRGNLYSIDYDHLSLSTDRPATAGQAAGWHRLETREGSGGKELWACSVEWVEEAKEGLEATPPKWRYFSPAYLQDEETSEVVSYTNTALCINPATHNNNQLATRAAATTKKKATKMDQAAMLAALKAILEGDADDDTKAKAQALYDALVAAVGGVAKAEEMMKAAESEAPAPEADPKKTDTEEAPKSEKEPKVAAKTMTKADSASADLAVRLATLEAKIEKDEVSRLVQDNVGKKIPESLKGWAAVQKLDTIKAFLKAAPLIGSTEVKSVAATRGSDVDAPVADAVSSHIDKVLGTRPAGTKRGMDSKAVDGIVTINLMTPTEARRLAAVK